MLVALSNGDGTASERLLEILYQELLRQADHYLRQERKDHTLQPTALVHEAWLRLVDQSRVEWQNRDHFLGVAAQAMRRVLVDHARGKKRLKRGAGWARVELEPELDPGRPALDFVELDLALEELRGIAPRQATIVEQRYFGGLSVEDAARIAGISVSTAEREWRVARAWLLARLQKGMD